MTNKEQTGKRSAADMDRKPWEPRSVREEVGMTVFYVSERLCYRVAFLLTGVCNRRRAPTGGSALPQPKRSCSASGSQVCRN